MKQAKRERVAPCSSLQAHRCADALDSMRSSGSQQAGICWRGHAMGLPENPADPADATHVAASLKSQFERTLTTTQMHGRPACPPGDPLAGELHALARVRPNAEKRAREAIARAVAQVRQALTPRSRDSAK
jgi:hypothetical protein